ncbi:MAG TPA: nicotinate-nucleotide--dimethylbenzimidazole phosphoribosyltransferase [Acidimicrobiia bacterium]|nr:nicotinate-nucleotide--dimethylbenzimidazole phosphoribosyltransferase [Acidimicrobiia bacterium]
MTATPNAFEAVAAAVGEVDDSAGRTAAEHHDRLTKPRGSLGRVEALGVRLAAIAGASPPPIPAPAAVAVFAGDHGVLAEGVTPWPQDVTAQMVQNFLAGGAAINVLARQTGARVIVVDVGVATDLDAAPGLVREKVRAGTGNIAREPAMTVAEARQALDAGAAVAARLVDDGAACLVTGDMGIGNTTPSAALVAAFTGRAADEVTGRGTGIDDPTLARKVEAVDAALARSATLDEPVAVLASLGGLEIAALTGFIIGGAAARVPVVVDGVIADAALLAAAQLVPGAVHFCFAGHRSTEPAARVTLDTLGLEPILDLELRLGEGSGACLALPVLEAAARILGEMATFDAAGVTDKPD